MGSIAVLCQIVHPGCSNLHFNPFSGWPHNGGMKTLITIAFRRTDPIPQSLGTWMIDICDDAVDLPAIRFFLLIGRINNNADRKQIVDLFESHVFCPHFIIDAEYRLGTAENLEFKSLLGEDLLEGFNEFLNKTFSFRFAFL